MCFREAIPLNRKGAPQSTAPRFKVKEPNMAAKKTTTVKIGRDAKTGEFIPVKEALRRPNTTLVETIKKSKK